STLRQVAVRLGGTYHNGNEKQIPTDLLNTVTQRLEAGPFERLTRREYALLATGLGALVWALLPLALHAAGTSWRPGTPVHRVRKSNPAGRNIPLPREDKIDTPLVGSIR